MTDIERWWLALGIVAAVVVVVALLLGMVIVVAMGIDRRAGQLWSAAKEIAGNTASLWLLEQTNKELQAVRESARAVQQAIASLNGDLEAALTQDDKGSGIARKVRGWVHGDDAASEEGG